MKQKSVMQQIKNNKENLSAVVLSMLLFIYIFTVLKYYDLG